MLIALLLAAAGQAQVLAVLEFKDKLAKGGAQMDVGYLTDVVRDAAKEAVPNLKVMTRENMLVMLQASGKKMEECEGECEVDTGRRVGADVVISGEVLRFGSQYKVNMKLHDTHEGELLSGVIASGANADELDRNLVAAVAKLLAPLKGGAAPVAEEKPAPPKPPPATQPPAANPWARNQATTPAASAPAPGAPEEYSPFGAHAHVDVGYFSGSSSAGGSDATGTLYGLGGLVEWRLTRNLALGVFGEFSELSDSSASLSHLSVGPSVDLRAGAFSGSLGLGYGAWSDNGGGGVSLLIAADYALIGPLAVHAQLTYGAAHPEIGVSAGGTGVTTDVPTVSFTTLEIGVGILY